MKSSVIGGANLSPPKKIKGLHYTTYAFTEDGVAQLSEVEFKKLEIAICDIKFAKQ
ncbi:MAG: hypothetical protein K8R54_13700 [Bacteroidales bacterium]|nr:hypothetical protein [Bacteroidales bacterium]